jgi:CRP-like cAMP-binding protein
VENQEFLAQVPLFADLSKHHLKGLARACTERTYKADDVIVKQGNPGIGLFIIVSGTVVVQKTTEQGKRIEIATHGPGEVIGEMAVLDGAPRSADVIAKEETKVLILASWDFKSFMNTHPEVALEILPVIVRRFRETNEALTGIQAQQG